MPEGGVRYTRFFRTVSIFEYPVLAGPALPPPASRAPEREASVVGNIIKIKAARITKLAVFFGVPLAVATVILASIASSLFQSGAYALASVSGIDIDVPDIFFEDEAAR